MATEGQPLYALLRNLEAEAVVGRAHELAVLEHAFAGTAQHAAAVYVHGAEAVGKSSLLQEFARRSRRAGHVAVSFSPPPQADAHTLMEALADAIARETGKPVEPTSAGITSALSQVAAHDGLVLAADDWDHLGDAERWLRETILYALAERVVIVLAGRADPARLWAAERTWRTFVQDLPLGDLDDDDARELLRLHGVSDPAAMEEALAISNGRPQLLLRAAEAVAEQAATTDTPDAAPPWPEEARRNRVSTLLVERLLHPGSRRASWRAGEDVEPTDLALAAMSLLPWFDHGVLGAVLDAETAKAAWPRLKAIPGVVQHAGRYELPRALQTRVRAMVLQRRPWAGIWWRRQAILHGLERAHHAALPNEQGVLWSLVSAVAWETPWYPLLRPAAEETQGWQVAFGAQDADEPALTACAAAAGDGTKSQVQRLFEAQPGSFLLLRNAHRDILGFLVISEGAPRHGRPAPAAPRANADAASSTPLTLGPGLAAEPGVVGVLLREAVQLFANRNRIVAKPADLTSTYEPNAWTTLLTVLGFGAEGRAHDMQLSLAPTGFAGWLERMVGRTSDPVREAEQIPATKDALRALHSLAALDQTRAAEHFRKLYGDCEAALVHAWLMDALRSCTLSGMSQVERSLLLGYYGERAGSHERVAEALGLPRTSYFRLHQRALQRLASNLFSYP